jgi:hypothetical protein
MHRLVFILRPFTREFLSLNSFHSSLPLLATNIFQDNGVNGIRGEAVGSGTALQVERLRICFPIGFFI